MIIALHGDLATPAMLERDVGDLASTVDLFFDARGWLRFDVQFEKLLNVVRMLPEPPIMIGYSRGGSAIAKLSEIVPLAAAVLYESPVIDSDGVGGSFPVLQIWNDQGAKYGRSKLRQGQAKVAEEIWSSHPVTKLEGAGRHMTINPPAHGWDCGLNKQIADWISGATKV